MKKLYYLESSQKILQIKTNPIVLVLTIEQTWPKTSKKLYSSKLNSILQNLEIRFSCVFKSAKMAIKAEKFLHLTSFQMSPCICIRGFVCLLVGENMVINRISFKCQKHKKDTLSCEVRQQILQPSLGHPGHTETKARCVLHPQPSNTVSQS